MKSNIFSLNKNFLGVYVDSFITYKDLFVSEKTSFIPYQYPLAKETAERKVYLTDLDRDITYAGTVDSLKHINGNVQVSLTDVQVYQYSTSSPLYDLPTINFTRPENKLYIEEAE